MTSSQYNNIVQYTLANMTAEDSQDSAVVTRKIMNNCGVGFPHGNNLEIMLTLLSEDYMGWRSCTRTDAQQMANNGIATIGVSPERAVVIKAEGGEEINNLLVLDENSEYAATISELPLAQTYNMAFFNYSADTTTPPVAEYTIYVYNPGNNIIETYYKNGSDSMPYNTGATLKVSEFRGSSSAKHLYTDKRAMEAWNSFRSYYGKGIHVGYAFKRIWEGGHGVTSQHYAGLAFAVGQNLGSSERENLRAAARNCGLWGYVEPASEAPTWVHFDRRLVSGSGYSQIQEGAKGVYVFILQDALNALGYTGSAFNGTFSSATTASVKRFQRDKGLSVDGIVGSNTWNKLANAAKGIGKTSTVVNP